MAETLNREGWLHKMAEEYIAPHIASHAGLTVPMGKVLISVGFPPSRARPNKDGVYTTGVCMHGDGQGGTHHIFIHPGRDHAIREDGTGILETLMHELIHASLPSKAMHGAPFARAAKACGLEGKPTSTLAGQHLVQTMQGWLGKVGKYPHKAVDAGGHKKQTTRLLKVVCPDCGYTARVTKKWIDCGLPICPCGEQMVAVGMDDPIMILKPIESAATFAVPLPDSKETDNRFQIRRTTGPTGEHWTVIDYGQNTYTRKTIVDGEEIEVEVPVLGIQQARVVSADDRDDAISMISGIREGLYTWDELETAPEEEGEEFDEDEDPEADWWEDGDETADHPDMVLTPDEEEEYERQSVMREKSGARKSMQIGNMNEKAMD